MPARLQEHYEKVARAELLKQFGYGNPMEVPKLDKVVINMGVGEAVADRRRSTTLPSSSPASPARGR